MATGPVGPVPLTATGTICVPEWPVVVYAHVVDAPAASDVAPHCMAPDVVEPEMPVIVVVPEFDTGTTTTTGWPTVTPGPGSVPAGWPFTVGVPIVSPLPASQPQPGRKTGDGAEVSAVAFSVSGLWSPSASEPEDAATDAGLRFARGRFTIPL